MSDRSLAELEEFFLALSDGTRLKLLALMRTGEVSVGYLADALETSQPKISRHLAYLRSAGLVYTRRDGKWIYYSIASLAPAIASLLDQALDWAAGESSPRTVESLAATAQNHVSSHTFSLNDMVEFRPNDIEIFLL